MTIDKDNPGDTADENLNKEIKDEEHLLLDFPGQIDEEEPALFREMIVLPNLEAPVTGIDGSTPESDDMPELPVFNDSHIISFLKDGLS